MICAIAARDELGRRGVSGDVTIGRSRVSLPFSSILTPSRFFPLLYLNSIMSDDEQHNQTFETAGAGASLTYPMQCSALRKR